MNPISVLCPICGEPRGRWCSHPERLAAARDPLNIANLRELHTRATPAPWSLWTSNSRRRITGPDGRDGGVLDAVEYRGDAPDLGGYNIAADLDLIVSMRNALPRVLDELARLRVAERASGRIMEATAVTLATSIAAWLDRCADHYAHNAQLGPFCRELAECVRRCKIDEVP